MGAIKKFNPETGKWEVYGSTDATDINLLDLGDNFETKNVEGALREISKKINKTLENVTAQQNAINEHTESLAQHSSDIEWLKQYGGGGGGGYHTGTNLTGDGGSGCVIIRWGYEIPEDFISYKGYTTSYEFNSFTEEDFVYIYCFSNQ